MAMVRRAFNLTICSHALCRRAVWCSLPVPELLRTYSHTFSHNDLYCLLRIAGDGVQDAYCG